MKVQQKQVLIQRTWWHFRDKSYLTPVDRNMAFFSGWVSPLHQSNTCTFIKPEPLPTCFLSLSLLASYLFIPQYFTFNYVFSLPSLGKQIFFPLLYLVDDNELMIMWLCNAAGCCQHCNSRWEGIPWPYYQIYQHEVPYRTVCSFTC